MPARGMTALMAERDSSWEATDVVGSRPLPSRRFIKGGRIRSRWYVWYEQGGIGHSYHLAIFDLAGATATPDLIVHKNTWIEDLCPVTEVSMQSVDDSMLS